MKVFILILIAATLNLADAMNRAVSLDSSVNKEISYGPENPESREITFAQGDDDDEGLDRLYAMFNSKRSNGLPSTSDSPSTSAGTVRQQPLNDDFVAPVESLADTQMDIKQFIERKFAHGRRLFPEQCMARWYDRKVASGQPFPFNQLSDLDYTDPRAFDQWISVVSDSSTDPYRFFHLALWALLERPSYESLNGFHIEGGSDLYTVNRNFIALTANRRPIAEPFDHGGRYLLGIYVLGELSIPENEEQTREQLDRLIREVYNPKCGAFNPGVLITVGYWILTKLSTWNGSGFQSERKNYKQQKDLAKNFHDNYKNNMRELAELVKTHGQTDDAHNDQVIAKVFALAHYDLSMNMMRSLDSYFNAIATLDVAKYDPRPYFSDTKFNIKNSRFLKTLAYFGQTFLKIGLEMLDKMKKPNADLRLSEMIRAELFVKNAEDAKKLLLVEMND